ncbi:ankyrin repeat-containing domain protein [Baffinella frigidus]|nr:ankyrin repeat-containing domain protein [Cryptophyta sp. CCMP2293]
MAASTRAALLHAAADGRTDYVDRLLAEGADIQKQDQDGLSPLHMAVWMGHRTTVQTLLDNGAKFNVTTKRGYTPLDSAAATGNGEIALMLLDKGADVHMKTKQGHTTFHKVAEDGDRDCVFRFRLIRLKRYPGTRVVVFQCSRLFWRRASGEARHEWERGTGRRDAWCTSFCKRSTQRATKGFSAQIGPPFRYLIHRNPPMPLRLAYGRVVGLIA